MPGFSDSLRRRYKNKWAKKLTGQGARNNHQEQSAGQASRQLTSKRKSRLLEMKTEKQSKKQFKKRSKPKKA